MHSRFLLLLLLFTVSEGWYAMYGSLGLHDVSILTPLLWFQWLEDRLGDFSCAEAILIWFCEMGIFIMSWTCKGFTDGLMTEAISCYSSCSMFSLTNLSGHILNFFGHGLTYLLLELHSSCTFLPWHQTLLQSSPHSLTMCSCGNSWINRKAFIIKMYNMSKPSLYENRRPHKGLMPMETSRMKPKWYTSHGDMASNIQFANGTPPYGMVCTLYVLGSIMHSTILKFQLFLLRKPDLIAGDCSPE